MKWYTLYIKRGHVLWLIPTLFSNLLYYLPTFYSFFSLSFYRFAPFFHWRLYKLSPRIGSFLSKTFYCVIPHSIVTWESNELSKFKLELRFSIFNLFIFYRLGKFTQLRKYFYTVSKLLFLKNMIIQIYSTSSLNLGLGTSALLVRYLRVCIK